jgi:hypothetical protein
MSNRNRAKQSKSFKQRIEEFAEGLTSEMKNLIPGPEQDQLREKLRRAEAAARLDAWANSAELRKPVDDRKVRPSGRGST